MCVSVCTIIVAYTFFYDNRGLLTIIIVSLTDLLIWIMSDRRISLKKMKMKGADNMFYIVMHVWYVTNVSGPFRQTRTYIESG